MYFEIQKSVLLFSGITSQGILADEGVEANACSSASVFTRISPYVKWIRDTVGDNNCFADDHGTLQSILFGDEFRTAFGDDYFDDDYFD